MKKVFFRFPGGAGGHWLRHICYCAENNDYSPIITETNFHNKKLSYNVLGSHDKEDVAFLLSSKYKFNLYLNAVLKDESCNLPNDWFNSADNYITETRYVQSEEFEKFYQQNIDIDISWTVTDPLTLLVTLFDILDENDIKYVKNIDNMQLKIKQYVDTCIDPYKHIGNLQSSYWQAWCLGFLPIDDVPSSFNNDHEVIELIKEKQNYYIEETQKWSYSLW